MLNKSVVTNLIALIVSVVGLWSVNPQLKAIGFYALSGALTNWLAIIMLFDKIPFLYGSGVIPRQFEKFKQAIKEMISTQFFNAHYIEKFLTSELLPDNKVLAKAMDKMDYDVLFDAFVEIIMESQFGGMIDAFLGGKEAIETMRDSFKKKLQASLHKMVEEGKAIDIQALLSEQLNAHRIAQKIEIMLDTRLQELTPKMVKQIIQKMIRKHLGWLVVWGGVFGAIIGLISTCL